MNKDKCRIEIFYSGEDEGYIALAPELPGCSAFGKTKSEALNELDRAMDLWIKVAMEDKEDIKTLEYMRKKTLEFREFDDVLKDLELNV